MRGKFFSWGFDKHDDYVADFTPLLVVFTSKSCVTAID